MPVHVQMRRNLWSTEEETLLIASRSEMKERFEKAHCKNDIWKEMSHVFMDKGFARSGKQLEDKWNKLKSSYSKELARRRHKSVDLGKCRQFDDMQDLMAKISAGRFDQKASSERNSVEGHEEIIESLEDESQSLSENGGDGEEELSESQCSPGHRSDGDSQERAFPRAVWTLEEEKLLITSRVANKDRFDRERNKLDIWKDISQVFADNGHNRSAKQLEDKWYKLKRNYNLELARQKSGSGGRPKCRLFKDMHDLLNNSVEQTSLEAVGAPTDAPSDAHRGGEGAATRRTTSQTSFLPRFNILSDDEEDGNASPEFEEAPRKRSRRTGPSDALDRELLDFLRVQAVKQDAAVERSHVLMEKMLDLKKQQLDIFKMLVARQTAGSCVCPKRRPASVSRH